MTSTPADAGGYARLAANAAASLAGRLVSVALALVLSTVLFRQLGPESYGVWSFCYVLVGYLTLLDFGLGTTVERLVAQAHAAADGHQAERVIRQAISLAVVVALFVQAVLLLLPLDRVTSVDLRAVTLALPACLFLSLMSTITGAGVSGTQDLRRLNLFRSSMNLVGSALVIALAMAGVEQVGWLMAAHGIGLAGAAALSSRDLSRKLGPLRLGLGWDRQLAREFLRFGGQMQVATFAPQLADQLFRLLLGARFGAAMIGFYDLGSRAGIVVRSIAGSLLVAMVPFGTQLHERAGREGLGRLYRIGVKYSALCLLPVTALALYHSRALIEAWLPGAPGADMVLFVFRVSLAAHALLGVSGPIAMVGRSAGVPATEAVTQSLAGAAGLALAAITAGAEGSVAVFTGAAAVGGMVLWGLLAARLSLPGAPVLRDLAATLAVALVTFVSVLAADYALPGIAASQGGLAKLARVALTSAASLPAGLGMVWLWGGLKRD